MWHKLFFDFLTVLIIFYHLLNLVQLKIRYLSIPLTRSNLQISSLKFLLFLSLKSPIFTPVITISLTPFDTINSAFLIIFSILSHRLLPLASGIVQ